MFFFQDICQVASRVKANDVRTRLRHTPLVRQSRHVGNVIYAVMMS
jgi:hypothetical protein